MPDPLPMGLAGALRKLADGVKTAKPAPELVARPPVDLAFTFGQVTAVTSGIVTVAVYGDTQQAAYLGALPTVGATVAVLLVDSGPLILGVINGIPTF